VCIGNFFLTRILFTSILIATKMFNDIYFYNKYYSEVGGVALNELNIMEE
jgi:hypothetical protein